MHTCLSVKRLYFHHACEEKERHGPNGNQPAAGSCWGSEDSVGNPSRSIEVGRDGAETRTCRRKGFVFAVPVGKIAPDFLFALRNR